jgi:transposase-like protein
MPPSRTVAPYSPTRTPLLGVEAVLGHEKHPPPFIRDTNAIEALNRQLRKAIKTKGHFPNEEAARKLIYLAIVNAVPAWTRTRNWTTALLAFKIHFGDRLPE